MANTYTQIYIHSVFSPMRRDCLIGAFSYGHSQLDAIIPYINNQKQHHQKRTFKEEYLGFLKKFEVEFKDEYVFNFFQD